MTVRNIRLWDPQVLLRSYSQLQELRPYYSFTTVSVDRYSVNGVYTQTMLAPRELRVSGLPPQAQTWVNQHITYTHGYGVTVSAVNQVASGGSPDFLVQDVPLVSSAPALAITQPQIYYGLLGTDYVLVKTKYPKFDYPGANGDVYSPYTGSGGIPIGSLLNRLAFAVRFGDYRFFTTSAITPQSRVIIRNNIRERLAAAAPFLTFDSNPYMVVADGRLYWIADAYTTTEPHPVLAAQRLDQLHPQLGEGRDRRLQRHDGLLRVRSAATRSSAHTRRSSPACSSPRLADAGDPAASTCATPRTSS